MFNDSDDRADLLHAHNKVNHSGDTGPSAGNTAKKKKIIIGAAIGGVAVLALILGLTLGGGDDGGGGNKPKPIIGGLNPYLVDESKTVNDDWAMSGVMMASDSVEEEVKLRRARLQGLQANATPALVDPAIIESGENNQLIKNLRWQFGQLDYTLTNLQITDDDNPDRYTPPREFLRAQDYIAPMRLDFVGLKVQSNPFSFSFNDERTEPAEQLLTTEGQSLFIMDKYLQMDMKLPSQRIFGLGERNREFKLEEGTWTMWANGRETPYDDGMGGKQTYGVHPFALVQTGTKGRYFGIYFRNTNAASPIIKYNDDGSSILSYITTGGVIDVYFFLKDSAKNIIKQYQQLIGLPALPPFWSLGWHAASYGYTNLTQVDDNVKGYAGADLPLEGVWLDITYMDAYSDFSVNQTGFPDLKGYTEALQASGQKMTVIVDAGISADELTNKYWRKANQENKLIKSLINPLEFNGALSTTVWPKHTVFLDFMDEGACSIWEEGLTDLHELVPYDGLWLDMNEITSFCNGECPRGLQDNAGRTVEKVRDSSSWFQSYPQDQNSTFFLPFIPGSENLDFMAMSLNATHPSNDLREYDVHSLFGHIETMRTWNFLAGENSPNKNKRPFILSRSTFAGSGNHTQHWLGDNHREWAYMNYSISGVMNFNMFGIPMVGPDTCGFFEARTEAERIDAEQLCGRWYQLATFYPFGRQHRDKDNADGGRGGAKNEPYLLQEPYKSWASNSLYQRLQYSRQMYSCLFEASFQGQTCFDPLLFHYPDDDNVFEDIEHTFIFANAIKVSPVLQSNVTHISSYFPAGNWVNVNNYSDIVRVSCDNSSDDCYGTYGEWVNLSANANSTDGTVQAHMMPGSMHAFQDNSAKKHKLTSDIIKEPVTLIANRDHRGHAMGNLFLDDGESLDQLTNNTYEFYQFQISANSVKKWILNEDSRSVSSGIGIDKIVIVDAQDLNSTDFACFSTNEQGADGFSARTNLKFAYDNESLSLTISSEDGSNIDPFTMRDIYFGDSAKDPNLCEPVSQQFYYHTKDFAAVDLTQPNATVVLESTAGALADLELEMSVLASGIVNVHWTFADMKNKQKIPFEVPKDIVDPKAVGLSDLPLSDFVTVTQDQDKPIQIEISNQKGTKVYTLDGMVLTEYLNYIQATIKTDPGSKGLIGLFDRTVLDLYLQDGVFTLWPRDINHPDEDGKPPGKQVYGVHPMYYARASDKTWFGVYSNLAAAQDWWLKNDQTSGEVKLTTVATGGVGDLFFFFGEDAPTLMKNYNDIIGLPVLVPQWIYGWGQCRWGYNSTDVLRQVVGNYSVNDLPMDNIWTDIDYLKNYKDFTYNDNQNWRDLPEFVDEMHAKNITYVPIIDIGISQRGSGYEAYTDGLQKDLFIKTEQGEVFSGRVWPGDTAFPDWFKEGTEQYWVDHIEDFYSQVKFDGIWLDMNEASTMCNGVCYDDQRAKYPVQWKLPYIPGGRTLDDHSTDLDAISGNGYSEVDNRAMTAYYEVKATHKWFDSKQMRSLIISRGNFPGLGKWGSRWGADNRPIPSQMAFSMIGLMYHNMMGIPFAGSDVCGVGDNTTPELCARWHNVAAFYTFSRNHNHWDSLPQEPYVFTEIYDKSITYLEIMRNAIKTKYRMIRYMYTELSLISQEGGVFMRPLFFEFPDDTQAYEDQYNSVMLGEGLKLAILTNAVNQNSTDFYFPAGTWCNINKKGMKTETCSKYTEGTMVTLDTYAFNFYLHLREGFIVPMQDTYSLNFSNSVDLQDQHVDFHVNPLCAATCNATGRYLNDDGLVYELEGNRNVYKLDLSTDAQGEMTLSVNTTKTASNYDKNFVNMNDIMGNVFVYNAAANGYNQNYTITATLADGSTEPFDDAVYQEATDSLLIAPRRSMHYFTKLTLSKK